MRPLDKLEILADDESDEDNPGHIGMLVRTTLWRLSEPDPPDEYDAIPQAKLDRLAVRTCGTLARLAMVANDYLVMEARDHSCRPKRHVEVSCDGELLVHGRGCGAHMFHSGLIHAAHDLGWDPAVYLDVPTERVKFWKRWVRDTLAAMADPRGSSFPRYEPLTKEAA